MTYAQYYATKYQAESLIFATGNGSKHLYANQYDPNLEQIKDLVLLSQHCDKWCEHSPGSSTEGEISAHRHDELHKAVRSIDWDKIKNTRRTDVINDGEEHCRSLDLMKHLKDPKFKKAYDKLITLIHSSTKHHSV